MPHVFCCGLVKLSKKEKVQDANMARFIGWATSSETVSSRDLQDSKMKCTDSHPLCSIEWIERYEESVYYAKKVFVPSDDKDEIFNKASEERLEVEDLNVPFPSENADTYTALRCERHYFNFYLRTFGMGPEEDVKDLNPAMGALSIERHKDELVDTVEEVSCLVDALHALPYDPPSLYVDLEGENLSRYGTISILQIYDMMSQQTYLVDVHILQHKAFTTTGSAGVSLKDILESDEIPKVFFDVRNDSNALFFLYGIRLDCIHDLQLMEFGARRTPPRKRYVSGLARCIERDAPMTDQEKKLWLATKLLGRELFTRENGGSWNVFNQRPLSKDLTEYCAQDVQFLPRLWNRYHTDLDRSWRRRVLRESWKRVQLSQSEEFDGKGKHMAEAPAGWS